MLQAGTKAPDFTLNDKDGNPVTLSSFLGKKVVLYFYPKDTHRAAPVRRVPLPARMRDISRGVEVME